MNDFVVDAEFRDIIPPLAPDEYEGLKALIQEAGRARDTLKVWNGVLLDGHNRYGICLELGLPYATEEVAGISSRNEALLWIIRNQHGRRNLSLVDRALLATKEQDILAVEAAKVKSEAIIASNKARAASATAEADENPILPVLVKLDVDDEPPRNALREAAAKFGVGHETLRQVRILNEEAPDRIDIIRDGKSTINKEFKSLFG